MTSRSASDPAKAFFAVTVPTCLFSSLELQPAPALSPDVAPARFGSSYSRSEPALAENRSCARHVAPGTAGAEESWGDGAFCLLPLPAASRAATGLSAGAALALASLPGNMHEQGWEGLGQPRRAPCPAGWGPAPAVGSI